MKKSYRPQLLLFSAAFTLGGACSSNDYSLGGSSGGAGGIGDAPAGSAGAGAAGLVRDAGGSGGMGDAPGRSSGGNASVPSVGVGSGGAAGDSGATGDGGAAGEGVHCLGMFVEIKSQADADRLADCSVLNGVYISHVDSPLVIDWSVLTEVRGGLYFDHTSQLTRISLSNLRSVGDKLYFDSNAALTTVSLPSIESVASDLFFNSNLQLEMLTLPRLTSVGGNLSFDGNPALDFLSLPMLESKLDTLSFNHELMLKFVSLPKVTSLGTLHADSNPILSSIDLSSLLSLTGGPVVGIQLPDGPALDLRTAVYLANNPSLSNLILPLLTDATGSAYIVGNSSLCVTQDWATLTHNNSRTYIADNRCGSAGDTGDPPVAGSAAGTAGAP